MSIIMVKLNRNFQPPEVSTVFVYAAILGYFQLTLIEMYFVTGSFLLFQKVQFLDTRNDLQC